MPPSEPAYTLHGTCPEEAKQSYSQQKLGLVTKMMLMLST
jgi:hypothetical protein